MKISIRKTEDLDTVDSLDRACFPADLREDFTNQTCWLATSDDGEPMGFTAMTHGKEPAITRMGVLPEYRGHRLQRRLARVCIAEATRTGCEALYTYVSVYNLESLRSLIHSGFMPYSCENGWMQLGCWTKHRPVAKRHYKFWVDASNRSR